MLEIISFFLMLIVNCIGLVLAIIFVGIYGSHYLLTSIKTIGALPTSLLISGATLVYYWLRQNNQKSNSYQLYHHKQSAVVTVVYTVFTALVSSFLFCSIMGLWKYMAFLAFGPWVLSMIAFFGCAWLIDKKKHPRYSKPYR